MASLLTQILNFAYQNDKPLLIVQYFNVVNDDNNRHDFQQQM